jgi:hypothetical protein
VLAEIFLGKRLQEFVYPLAPVPRTAVLVPWFGQSRRSYPFRPGAYRDTPVCVFPRGWCLEALAFAPASIAATMQQFIVLGQSNLQLTHAAIVLARREQMPVTEAQRDWLWRRFRVPVFEQIIGPDGELLAAECEAHDGLHASPAEPLLHDEWFDPAPCPCGRHTPRIRVPRGAALEQRVAAYAR